MSCNVILIETRFEKLDMYEWSMSTPVPLSNIGRETVLGRLQRQLCEMGLEPVVLADDYDVMAESKKVCLGDELPEHYAHLPGNAVYEDYMDILDAIHDKPDRNVHYIERTEDYWCLVREVINAGKLNPTE